MYIVIGDRVDVFSNVGDSVGQLPFPEGLNLDGNSAIGKSQLSAQHVTGDPSASNGWCLNVLTAVPRKRGNEQKWLTDVKRYPIDAATVGFFLQWLCAEPQRSIFRFCGTALTPDREIGSDIEELQAQLPPVEDIQEEVYSRGGTVVLTAHFTQSSQGQLTVSLMTVAGTEALQLQMRTDHSLADLLHRVGNAPRYEHNHVVIALSDGRPILSMSGITSLAEVLASLQHSQV